MENSYFTEKDWKLYRSRIADWQEAYIEKLCKEYVEILSTDENASDRFWELHDRIKEDKRSTGVIVRNSRSKMVDNILGLLMDGVITTDDLDGFSDEFRERIGFIIKNHPDHFPDKNVQ